MRLIGAVSTYSSRGGVRRFRICSRDSGGATAATSEQGVSRDKHGQAIFRFDTFGDEQLWTDGCGCTKSFRRSIQRQRWPLV